MNEKIIPVKYYCESCHNEKVVLFAIGEKNPDRIRCAGKCTGSMERKTSDIEIVQRERVARCASANTDPSKRMRHCVTCEVPVGTMELSAFNRRKKCFVCGGSIR